MFVILRFLAAAALFLFMAWALRLIWLDLRRQARVTGVPRIPDLSLLSVDNPSSASFQAASESILVGRDPACDLHLADKAISGQHARLFYHLGQWWIEDLHSTNGTFINEQAVDSPVVLAGGDELRFGGLTYRVDIPITLEE